MTIKTKYGLSISQQDLDTYVIILKNKIYKLLPLREEGLEWQKFLNSILVELGGLEGLLENKRVELLILSAKLEGLYKLEDFMVYRRTIFECLNIVEDLNK